MSNFKDTVLKGLYYKYLGKRQTLLADLNVILDNPVGVGDHAVGSKDVENLVTELEGVTSIIDTLVEEFEDVVLDSSPFAGVEVDAPEGLTCEVPAEEASPAGGTPGPDADPECCDDDKCGC